MKTMFALIIFSSVHAGTTITIDTFSTREECEAIKELVIEEARDARSFLTPIDISVIVCRAYEITNGI